MAPPTDTTKDLWHTEDLKFFADIDNTKDLTLSMMSPVTWSWCRPWLHLRLQGRYWNTKLSLMIIVQRSL